jgi:acyl-CoA thioesterase-1
MKARSLYPVVFLTVLFLFGCGSGNPEPPEQSTAPARADSAVGGAPPPAAPAGTRTILVLGNSLAAGLGLDPSQAFPAVLQQKIDSLGWPFQVVNAGLSGETTAGGLRRIDWLLQRPVDVLILELGGNDGLRGVPVETTEENLKAIIDKTRARYPDARIVLAGMQMPPNLGADYTRRFRDVYPKVADEKDAALIPFLLEGVGGVASMMQGDGIHPTAAGQRIVAQNVWAVLELVLRDLAPTS